MTITDSIFDGNSTDGNGGVVGVDHGFHSKVYNFQNCRITDNTGNYALYHYGSGSLAVDFSTVADNENGVYGNGDGLSVTNSIIANNASVGVSSNIDGATADYSDVWGHTSDYSDSASAGTGSLSVDPGFVDPAADNYHLLLSSSLLTAADPDATLSSDLEGAIRPQDGGFAMGAFETGVPEPTSIALLAFGALALLRRRRG